MVPRVLSSLLLLFVVSVSFDAFSNASPNNSSNINTYQLGKLKKQLLKDVKSELRLQGIPGGAYVLVKGDRVVALETLGHIDKGKSRKVNADTVFRLASVSKTFAGTLATMLSQERKLNLSAPVTRYVPKFELAKKGAADKIQLKHILSHSSGLMPNAYDNLLHENWSMDKIISRFDKVNPICKPQVCYGYQNVAFSFIEHAIEASQPKDYSTLLADRLFIPLEMKRASVGIDVFKKGSNTAQPHLLIKKLPTKKKDSKGNRIYNYHWRQTKVTPDFYKVAPAAGVNASINDMAKWLVANLGHKPEVLSPKLLKEITKPRTKTKKDMRRKHWKKHLTDAHYGYGWRIYQFKGKPMIYHSGWVAGFVAEVSYSPHLDMGFALLLNAESNAINKLSSRLWDNAYKVAKN